MPGYSQAIPPGHPFRTCRKSSVRGRKGVGFLLAKLQQPEVETGHSVEPRRKAAWALGQLGPAGREAVPALIQALQDKGDREDMPGGQTLISERVCVVAASALGNLGPAAREAVPALEESLHDGLGRALSALAKIAPESPRVLAVLTEALQDHRQVNQGIEISYRFCINAASALGRVGPAARPAIPALEKLLEHPNGWVKRNAAFSLWRLDGRTAIVPS